MASLEEDEVPRAMLVPIVVIAATVVGCGGPGPGGSGGEVFFPTWSGKDRMLAVVSEVLTERDRCLFLRSDDQDVLALWEQGYSYVDGVLLGPSGPVVREGKMLHGGGGYRSNWQAAEEIVGQTIPQRCRPDGVEPYALIYDVRPGPFVG